MLVGQGIHLACRKLRKESVCERGAQAVEANGGLYFYLSVFRADCTRILAFGCDFGVGDTLPTLR